MGKARRLRNKYHITSVKGDFEIAPDELNCLTDDRSKDSASDLDNQILNRVEDNSNTLDINDEGDAKITSMGWKVVPDENLFQNIDIDVDELQTCVDSVISDHKPTSVSISKCIKRSVLESGSSVQLKKEDKRELRRNLFIKKIDAIHQLVHQEKQVKKGKNIKGFSENLLDSKWRIPSASKNSKVVNVQKGSKSLNHLSNSNHAKITKRNKKTKTTLKQQNMEMLNNLELFKRLLSDEKYTIDALGVVTNAVQKQVYSGL